MNKFKKKIKEQAKSSQGTRTDFTSSPNGEKVKSIHTDKELAKKLVLVLVLLLVITKQ